jgi:hypothetical protein
MPVADFYHGCQGALSIISLMVATEGRGLQLQRAGSHWHSFWLQHKLQCEQPKQAAKTSSQNEWLPARWQNRSYKSGSLPDEALKPFHVYHSSEIKIWATWTLIKFSDI